MRTSILFLLLVPAIAQADYDYVPIEVPGAQNTWARGIDHAGRIVGSADYQGFVLDGKFTPILVPGTITEAYGIANGTVVGTCYDFRGRAHGFVFRGGAYMTMTDIRLQSVNDRGDLVGWVYNQR